MARENGIRDNNTSGRFCCDKMPPEMLGTLPVLLSILKEPSCLRMQIVQQYLRGTIPMLQYTKNAVQIYSDIRVFVPETYLEVQRGCCMKAWELWFPEQELELLFSFQG